MRFLNSDSCLHRSVSGFDKIDPDSTLKQFLKMLDPLCGNIKSGIAFVECVESGWGSMGIKQDLQGDKGIPCGEKIYPNGFGINSPGRIRISLAKKGKRFKAICGAMKMPGIINAYAEHPIPDLNFILESDGKPFFETGYISHGEVRFLDLPVPPGTVTLDLVVKSAHAAWAHAAWAEPEIEFEDNTKEDPSDYEINTLVMPGPMPVSFVYGSKNSDQWFLSKNAQCTIQEDKDKFLYTFIWKNSGLCVKLSLSVYREFPVLEWHTEFENYSRKTSEKLENVRVLDLKILTDNIKKFKLVRHKGSFTDREKPFKYIYSESYRKDETSCCEGDLISFGGTQGRPSDEWLPCFDLLSDTHNYRFVVGWSGQWKTDLKMTPSSVQISAGMEHISLILSPGEKISQPSVFLVGREGGDLDEISNIWRRFVLKQVMIDRPEDAPLSITTWGGLGEAIHLKQISFLEKSQIPYDVYWIDAGWYAAFSHDGFDLTWNKFVGTWQFYKETYPDELSKISCDLHKSKHKVLLWVEPERGIKNQGNVKDHPDWYLYNESKEALLNLGDPMVQKECFDMLARIISYNKLDFLRFDFNIYPLDYWQKNDSPDRIGINEIRFVEGTYKLWHDLRKTFPHLKIDNCSSGGRRLDIELCRYSIPLWMSDMCCNPDYDPDYALFQIQNLSHYLPVFGGCAKKNKICKDIDKQKGTYSLRSCYAQALAVRFPEEDHVSVSKRKLQWLLKNLKQYKSIKECFSSDFYLISGATPGKNDNWIIMQYDRSETGTGILMVFRPKCSNALKYVIKFKSLCPDSKYTVSDMDGYLQKQTVSGKILMEQGIFLELPDPETSAIIQYKCL